MRTRLAGACARAGRAQSCFGFVVGHWAAVHADGWFDEQTQVVPVPFSASAFGTPSIGAKRSFSTGRTAPRTSDPQMVREVGGSSALRMASIAHMVSKRVRKFVTTQCAGSAMALENFGASNSGLALNRTGTVFNMATCGGLTLGPRPLQIICVERTADDDVERAEPIRARAQPTDRPRRVCVCVCGAVVRGLRGGASCRGRCDATVGAASNPSRLAVVHGSVIRRTPSILLRWRVPAACRVPTAANSRCERQCSRQSRKGELTGHSGLLCSVTRSR